MSGDFKMIYDDHEVMEYLARLDEQKVVKILRSAGMRAGTKYRNAMRPNVPVKKRASAGTHGEYTQRRIVKDYGTPGGMRASVSARRIKSNPSIGVVVGPMGKQAFMRHWIAKGTKPHDIYPKSTLKKLAILGGFADVVHHPGSRPNDYAGRAYAIGDAPATEAAKNYIAKAVK
jgi:hypothetical protein